MELLGWTSSKDPAEFYFLIDQAVEAGYAERTGPGDNVRLTLAGYNHVAAMHAKKVNSKQAFIAMWFSEDMSKVYDDAIEPGVRDAGYNALRIDRKEHNNKIDDEIIAEIRQSRFVVADFTSEPQRPRGGVYFEAGFAYGLGLPVIWTCRSDLIGEVHFDTRQYNHIVWQDNDGLRVALKNRILAVVGPGPLLTLP
ncbi:MAG: nucleoside 2-deoxyribosyltransferase [Rhodospirillales bacterium]|nr:nucleoside 2-deoxyribosyltransferase [Rhodospirillales bacterium]